MMMIINIISIRLMIRNTMVNNYDPNFLGRFIMVKTIMIRMNTITKMEDEY